MIVRRKLRGRIKRRRKKGGSKVIETQFGTFDSEQEAERFQQLMTWEDEGRIENLRQGKRVELIPEFADMHGKVWTWHYTPDFVYFVPEYDIEVIEDYKSGHRPPEWRYKELVFRYIYLSTHFFVNERIDGWYVPPE